MKKFIKVDVNFIEIAESNYNKCFQKDSLNECTACDTTTHYLLTEACVSYTKIFTSATDYTEINAIANCKKAAQTNSDTECALCAD